MREIEVNEERLFINGQPVRLYGVTRHEYDGAISPERMIQDIQFVKRLNINVIRTAHYPNDPPVLPDSFLAIF